MFPKRLSPSKFTSLFEDNIGVSLGKIDGIDFILKWKEVWRPIGVIERA